MDKRFLMVGLGLIAAIAVVTLAILAGGPSRSTTTATTPPAPPTITNRGISQEDLDNPRTGTQDLVEVVQDFQLYSEDGDTVTLFTGDQVVPQPNFVADVVRPAAEVRSSDRRVLRITADAGRFYHPGNEPTRGEFHQNTVVTQYQAPDGKPLDLDSDDHVQFRLYLDQLTRFDRENGHITSEGPVRLVGPAVDFTGTGLDLTFNLLDQRVERLVIAQGDQLRLAQGSTFTTANNNPADADNADASDMTAPDTSGNNPEAAGPEPAQPYRVVLYDNLDILVGPDHTTLTGDRLEVLFTPAPGNAPGSTPGNDNPAAAALAPPQGSGTSVPVSATPSLSFINTNTNPSGGDPPARRPRPPHPRRGPRTAPRP
ncbi:MAG: hypothetical protein AAF086_05670, partial [Planctomycetota bacterium]